ncbi:hypothetical protein O181_035754 [Austropuccinia psidii MF-1]|uniref:Dihydrofolate reductase n=1 Tax=Austropuccinia psidii MF-1 TaxID=1389203 RepID=A0A9Q3D392_9BASI|nr:hypothetical protein [Austropuccinia psidii MF-1]
MNTMVNSGGNVKTPLHLIVCATKANGIGQGGKLPWRLKGDMNFFKHVTTLAPQGLKNVVIMGRKTWESIPSKFRPLPDRINVVVSRRSPKDAEGLGILRSQDSFLVNSVTSAGQLIRTFQNVHRVFLIGGAELYKSVLQAGSACDLFWPNTILLTRILSNHEFESSIDCFFPEIRPSLPGSLPNWSLCNPVDLQEYLSINGAASKYNLPDQLQEDDFCYRYELWKNKDHTK